VPDGKALTTSSLRAFKLIEVSEGKILIEANTLAKFASHGPVKPHFGHLYALPNNLHFSQRQTTTSPQLGQGNFVAPSPGRIILPHQLQVGILTVFASLIRYTLQLQTIHKASIYSLRRISGKLFIDLS